MVSVVPFLILASTVSVSSPKAVVGQPITITVSVANSGGAAHSSIVDMEVKDAAGAKIFQRFSAGQRLSGQKNRIYTYEWTPSARGRYSIDLGLFGPNWGAKYIPVWCGES